MKPLWPGAAITVLVAVGFASPGAAAVLARPATPSISVQPLAPDGRIDASTAPTSRLARTDPSLLGRTDTTPVPVVVKLDHDPVATYAGQVEGYPATSPAVTGEALDGDGAELAYEDYLAEREDSFAADLARVAPEATVRQRLRTVYGGVAASVPAHKIGEVLALDGVAAIQADEAREVLTDSSIPFIGADTLYPQLGGAADAGKGMVVGILDTGGWPEHPSFADLGNLDPPPGPPRECTFGGYPSFTCNNKLIGGHAFLDTYHEEVGDEPYPGTARDGNGHGTHVASTAAGNVLESAPVLGTDHGPVGGVAPGAWIVHYRVCGSGSCFVSDSAAAIQQAVRDRVDVLNFSISGGTEPFHDPVALAFLDAYAAGIFVAASAGNAGPDAGTTNHVAPWVTTVAASTQAREFGSTLNLAAGDATAQFEGASITGGVPEQLPVVLATEPPYDDPRCLEPAPAGVFEGMIVACERGENARVEKGYHVLQGGAAGMVLFNPEPGDTAADNHWLPAIHLADGTDLVAFLAEHDDVLGSFTDGEKRDGTGSNLMADFSSRGPGGLGLKPDITAPGVQILAGDVPTEGDPASGGGPAGELFQAISGTSMASPHIAGSALLLRALHPEWTPGKVKSALLTTARQDVVKEDTSTPADPLDFGSGHVDLATAGSPGLALDEPARSMVALGGEPANAVHLNLPSINAPVMPGAVTTSRTFENLTDQEQTYRVEVEQPEHGEIEVDPEVLTLDPGGSGDLQVTIAGDGTAIGEQQFGAIRLVPAGSGLPAQQLPVAFVPQQADVTLESTCDPDEIVLLGTSTCTVTTTNESFAGRTVDLRTTTSEQLQVAGAGGATRRDGSRVQRTAVTLAAAVPSTPALAPGANPLGEWVSLADHGVEAEPVGSASILNFTVPEFRYGHAVYDQIGVSTNGYAVVGGGIGVDVVGDPPGIPEPARPNNLLAPFWTDLDGRDATGIRPALVEVGVDAAAYLVVEWDVFAAGTTDAQVFQLWLGLSGEEEIAFAYDPERLPTSPYPFEVGAENVIGTGGDTLGVGVAPAGDLVVSSDDLVPGGSVSYDVQVRGVRPGTGEVTTTMVGDDLPGATIVTSEVAIHE